MVNRTVKFFFYIEKTKIYVIMKLIKRALVQAYFYKFLYWRFFSSKGSEEVEKIVYDAQIWDLHVHTPYKYDKSANSYNNDSNQIFVKKIIDIINKTDNKLKMISFTDHNYFNKEVYKLFKEFIQNNEIQIIPGIEIDLKLSNNDVKTKHILFYFPENSDYDELSKLLNDVVELKTKEMLFDDFITILFENNIKFAISPHAFKQRERGIETNWNDDDSDKNHQRIKMYSTNFFVFWEADKGSVPYAKEFIKKYYEDGEEAVTNFSDSHDYITFEEYLNNPTQYFYALNNFNGILMASSEKDRIVSKVKKRLTDQKIKEIIINGQNILLSDKLNVIIGGRGKGKSILLDKIGYYFECNSGLRSDLKNGRGKFLDKFDIEVLNFNGNKINKDFKVKYLNQSYIDTLFIDESSKKIETYFKEEFNAINIENIEISFNNLKKELLLIDNVKTCDNNVYGINQKLIRNIKQTFISSDKNNKIELLDLMVEDGDEIITYNKYFELKIPSKIINDEIQTNIYNLTCSILKSIFNYNYNNIEKYMLENISCDVLKESNEKLDSALKEKNNIITLIKEKLLYEYEQRIVAIRIINKLYDFSQEKAKLKIEYNEYCGENKNKFYFVKYNNVEHPIEFARRILIDAINGKIVQKKESLENADLFKYLICDESVFNVSYTKTSILEILQNLKGIKYETKNRIIHYIDENKEYQDLSISSPGVQTNSLMEYILSQNSDIPLLIDQPEDNVDNESRYSLLTKWIKKVKNYRQIILVSHDANIVINGDAENIIVAECINSNFIYSYGALEYKNNIDIAAKILDGGKNAVRKRIQKYGE